MLLSKMLQNLPDIVDQCLVGNAERLRAAPIALLVVVRLLGNLGCGSTSTLHEIGQRDVQGNGLISIVFTARALSIVRLRGILSLLLCVTFIKPVLKSNTRVPIRGIHGSQAR